MRESEAELARQPHGQCFGHAMIIADPKKRSIEYIASPANLADYAYDTAR